MISTAEYKDSEEETTIDSSYGMGFGDSDYEGSSTGTETDDDVTKNYWFGKRYFECVIAQPLFTQTSAREDVIVIDVRSIASSALFWNKTIIDTDYSRSWKVPFGNILMAKGWKS